ncbi:MAG TPA: hypothetical protein VKB76_11865, partial [Ktedonobacterales bacterium]|nr:hypothetical protein [Ktedonobacterales bacterium]
LKTGAQTYLLHLPGWLGGLALNGYAALYAVILNVVVAAVLSLVFNLVHLPNGSDATQASDYTAIDAGTGVAIPAGTGAIAAE